MNNYSRRIDEVNEANPNNPWKGNVWSFKIVNFLIVDDFESYNEIHPPHPESHRIFDIWIDGFGSTTNGAIVGYDLMWANHTIVHGGNQSMPYFYDNNLRTSEATANITNLPIDQDWTREGVGILSLWFYGNPANAPEPMYVALADATGAAAVVYYDDNPYAVLIDAWTQWTIDLQEFADQGVHLAGINTISIGFGDRNNPQPGGRGLMFFDDIRLYRP